MERTIPAPAHRLFDLVADPAMHPVIDGSGTVKAVADGAPDRLAPGARFGMAMRIGRPYRITNTVVEFEEGRLLAWDHLGRARWRYRFEPVDGGRATRVVETWDYSTAPRWLAPGPRAAGLPRPQPAGAWSAPSSAWRRRSRPPPGPADGTRAPDGRHWRR